METNKIFYSLTIEPIDGDTARLISIDGLKENDSIFSTLPNYVGNSFHQTSSELFIDKWDYEGKIYRIIEIGKCSLSHCHNLKKITIGPDVMKVDWNIYHCSSLTDIIVDPNNGVYHDKGGVLFKGSELVGFPHGRIGEYSIPCGTTKIGKMAFKSCHISKINIPDTVKEIGLNAFYECKNLHEIVLPRNIEKVENNYNAGWRPITQKFYLNEDIHKERPYSIEEVTKMFSV